MGELVYKADSSYAIGVDLGGTKIHAGLINEQGEVRYSHSLPTLAGVEPTEQRIRDVINQLVHQVQDENALKIRGIGVASAGQIDWNRGTVRFATETIPGYTGTPLRQMLIDHYGLPVFVDNDVNVLTLTEKRLGAGQGVRNLLCLALGTGVGGGIMIDGRILRGTWGGAGEIGHMSVNVEGPSCVCGGIGCLELYASGTGIAERMRGMLRTAGQSHPDLTSRDVITLWQSGDPLASEVMDGTFKALGSALASLMHLFNPEVIVIGGGVADTGDAFFTRVREETSRRAMPSFAEGVRIVPAYQGNWSGVIGAGLQLWEYV